MAQRAGNEPRVVPRARRGCGIDQRARAAEHCEIACYGRLIAPVKQPGRNDCGGILQKTPDEERAIDKKLTTLA